MPPPAKNLLFELRDIINARFNDYLGFKNFCQAIQSEIGIDFSAVLPVSGNKLDIILSVILEVKKQRKITTLIEQIELGAGATPDLDGFKDTFSQIFIKNNIGLDEMKREAFELLFVPINNEDLPFIGRSDFKEEIWKTIQSYPMSNLKMLVNGVQGVGITYLTKYLTNLDKKYNCLKNYVLIDCDQDLYKDDHEAVQPVHLAEVIAEYLDMDIPDFVDPDDPAKFKERYYARFFARVQSHCEDKAEGLFLFIDHLSHEMDGNVFRFLSKLIDRLDRFRVPAIVILGGLTQAQIETNELVKELTLRSFDEQDFTVYFKKIYSELDQQFGSQIDLGSSDDFAQTAMAAITENTRPEMLQTGIPKARQIQAAVKTYYDSTVELIKAQLDGEN